MNGVMKKHLVDSDCNGSVPSVAGGCQPPRFIHKFHYPTAMDVSLCVGMFWHHYLCQLYA
jgi:hypothetical protein